MTRHAASVTTYGVRVTCDRCGLRLYVYNRPGLDEWLRRLGWVVTGDRDLCPGCKEAAKPITIPSREF